MKRKPMGSYNPIYAILYAYFSEDENADDPAIYKIILSDYEFSDPPEPGCYEKPIFVLRDDEGMKELFDAAMKAAATHANSFQFEKNGRVLKYTVLETRQVDHALAAQYQIPKDIDWTDELHTVTVYYKSNKCFKKKHHCTAYKAKIRPEEQYKSFAESKTITVVRCDKCNKYFVTKEMLQSLGGAWIYYLKTNFDSSMSRNDIEHTVYADYYSHREEIFDDFAQHTSINNDGYTTTKPATQRQRLLRYFIDSGKYTEGEIVQYFHEQYLDTGWHGEEATQKVRSDLNYLLDYCTELKTIDAKLKRP